MPSYFDMISRADLDRILGSITEMLRGGGIFLGGAIILEILALLVFFGALIGGRKLLFMLAGALAVAGAGLGALGSWWGYKSASNVVSMAKATPKPEELDGAADQMAFALGAPATVATVLILATAFGAILRKENPESSV